MNLPEFGLPERLNVPPFGEQRARLRRQIVLGMKILAVVIVLWLIIVGVTSCVNAIANMGNTAEGQPDAASAVAASALIPVMVGIVGLGQ